MSKAEDEYGDRLWKDYQRVLRAEQELSDAKAAHAYTVAQRASIIDASETWNAAIEALSKRPLLDRLGKGGQ